MNDQFSAPQTNQPIRETVEAKAPANQTPLQTTLINPALPEDAENDNVSQPKFFRGLLSEEDCLKILALPEDQYLTEQFLLNQRQLMPGYTSYMRCQSRVVPMQAESDWLFEHLHTILSAVNHKHFHFEAERLMGTQILTLENGQQLDWHSSLGGGLFATRKLMLMAFLSPDPSYSGGEFELLGSPFATMRRSQGMIVTCPAFAVSKIHPVTEGKMHLLVSWLHGKEPFS